MELEDYPASISLEENANVTLGIENYENQTTDYIVKVSFDGQDLQTIGPLSLVDQEKWTYPLSLRPSRTGENQKVELFLYKNQEATPYLNLRLWLDVK